MKIAIDCRSILNPASGEAAGVGHYTFEIVKGLLAIDQQNDYVLFLNRGVPHGVIDELIGSRVGVRIKYFPCLKCKKFLPFVYSHALIGRTIARVRPDVLFVPTHELPLCYKGRTVIFVHDLAILAHPEWFPSSWHRRMISTRLLLPRQISKADRIIVPSEATKEDLAKFFPGSEQKTAIVLHGAERHFDCRHELTEKMRDKWGVPGQYYLTLCTLEPRKNIQGTVLGFDHFLDRFPSRAKDLRLVVAGKMGWKHDKIFAAIDKVNKKWQEHAGTDVVRYVGYVSSDEKWALMANTLAFIYPSYYEGFGLPVLEAMGIGVPVITSRMTSIPEVGGEVVLYANPDEPQEIATHLEQLIDLEYNKKIALAGLERAKQFNWEQTAERTLEQINQKDD